MIFCIHAESNVEGRGILCEGGWMVAILCLCYYAYGDIMPMILCL